MSFRTLYVLSTLAVLVSAPLSFYKGGWNGLAGLALGLFASGFGIVVWWYVTGLICNGAKHGAKPMFGSVVTVLAFLIKLPLFFAAANLAVKIGAEARSCFIWGLGLVYCCLVGRSLARDADQPE